jgi:beta-glucosidase
MVMTDWWGSKNTELLISSGTDIEMPEPDTLKAEKLLPLIKSGKVTEKYIEERISNVLRPCFQMGLFDIPHQDTSMRNNWPAHAEVARQIAREGLVLLKNDSILPLDRKKIKSIALVGSNAENTVSTGGGAAGFDPGKDFITYAAAIKKSAGESINVYTAGPEQAKNADVAVVFATMVEHEAMDRPFAFSKETVEMINQTAKANKNTVVVVSLGGGVDMMPWLGNVKALVYAWYPGTYGSVALGETLFGDINPSGKLPITIEKRPEDTHYYGNYLPKGATLSYEFPGWGTKRPQYDINYREDLLVGYRWFDTKKIEPLFPFGFGLSYTTFKFDDLKLSHKTISGDKELTVTFKLTNTGKVDGAQVAQLYIQDVESSVLRPAKELKGFKKVFLKAGQTKSVKLTIDKNALSFWNEETKQWYAEPGKFKAMVGSSSRDIAQQAEFVYKN